MFKILLSILSIATLLQASCYKGELGSNIELQEGNLSCANIDGYSICINRDIVTQKASTKEYQHICINGEEIASGYAGRKNSTAKVDKWLLNPYIIIKHNKLFFHLNGNKYSYNYDQEQFYRLSMPPNIINIYNFYHHFTAYQYSDDQNNLSLILYSDDKSKAYRFIGDKNIILKSQLRHLVVDTFDDFIDDKNRSIIDHNQFDKRIGSQSDFRDQFIALLSQKSPTGNQIPKEIRKDNTKREVATITLKPDKNIRTDHNKTRINTFILNSSLEIISHQSMEIDKNNFWKYLDSYDILYQDMPQFVHGYGSIAILLATLAIYIFAFYFVKHLVGGYTLPTITSFFLLFYMMIVVTGATLLNIFHFEYEYNLYFYERPDLLLNVWIYSISGLFFIPLGMYIANKLWRYKSQESFHLFTTNRFDMQNQKRLFYGVVLLTMLSVGVLFLYISKLDSLPILALFGNADSNQLALLRSDATHEFGGKIYRYLFFYKTLPMIYLIIAFISRKIDKKWYGLFLFLLFYNLFVSIMNLQKAPIIIMSLMLIVTYFYTIYKIKWKSMLYFALILFGVLILMYLFMMGIGKRDIWTILAGPFHRAFIGTVSPLFWWQLYIEQHGLLHGATLPNPRHIFDFDTIPITKVVYDFVHPYMKEKGIVGSMPAVFWADWFINFGIYALFASMVVFGFVMQTLDILFVTLLKNKKSVVVTALHIYLIFYFERYIATTNSNMLIDPNLLLPMILFFVFQWITENKEKINTMIN